MHLPPEPHRIMLSTFESAVAYTKAGISVIPILPTEAATPNAKERTPFDCREYVRQRIATREELRLWFADHGQFGMAAVLGPISGGLECLDLTYAAVVKLFQQLVTLQGGAVLLEKLPTAKSTLEGRTRLYYRCPIPPEGTSGWPSLNFPANPEPSGCSYWLLSTGRIAGPYCQTYLPPLTSLTTSMSGLAGI